MEQVQVSQQALNEVEAALKRYRHEVEEAPLAPATQRTYLQHAESFVRWLRGEFTPGEKV